MRGGARSLPLQQQSEHEHVGDKEQRYEDGHDKVGSAQLTRPQTNLIALIECVEEIGSAPEVEDSGQDDSQRRVQSRRQCQQGKNGGNEIAVRCGSCELGQPSLGTQRRVPGRRDQRTGSNEEAAEAAARRRETGGGVPARCTAPSQFPKQ
jgi:hypothetical protein